MSIEAVHWALHVPIGGNAKVVLLGLANHAHPDGRESYPALDTLAKYAACDRSTARRNVRKLVAEGWAIEDGNGPRGQTKYRLPLHRERGSKTPPVADCEGGAGASEGVAPMPPEPYIEPLNASTTERARADEIPDGFPDDLRPHARAVTLVLREVALERDANAVTIRAVGRAVMDNAHKPLVRTAMELRAWLLDGAGRAKPCADVVRRYRDWLRREQDLAGLERLADDGTPAAPVAQHPPGVVPLNGRRYDKHAAKAAREQRRHEALERVIAERQAAQ